MTKTIIDKGPAKRRISHKTVAKALGAEDTGFTTDTRRGPISLIYLRQFLIDKLRSTGGRPKLEGTGKKRNKIPLFDEDWEKLDEIAKYLKSTAGIEVGSGQIASTLIHLGVSMIDMSEIEKKLRSGSK